MEISASSQPVTFTLANGEQIAVSIEEAPLAPNDGGFFLRVISVGRGSRELLVKPSSSNSLHITTARALAHDEELRSAHAATRKNERPAAAIRFLKH